MNTDIPTDALPEELILDENDPIVAEAIELAKAFVAHCEKHNMMDGIFCGAVPDADAMASHYYLAGLDQVSGMVDMIKQNHAASRSSLSQDAEASAPLASDGSEDDGAWTAKHITANADFTVFTAWDETGANEIGDYPSNEEAVTALIAYAAGIENANS